MKLNKTSYVHKVIRLFCFYLEQSTGLQMITNLDEEFEEIQFKGKLSYLVIDWKNEMYSVLSHRVTQKEADIIDDIKSVLPVKKKGNNVQKCRNYEFLKNILATNEKMVYASLRLMPKHIEEIQEETGLLPEELSAALEILSSNGCIKRYGQAYYALSDEIDR